MCRGWLTLVFRRSEDARFDVLGFVRRSKRFARAERRCAARTVPKSAVRPDFSAANLRYVDAKNFC